MKNKYVAFALNFLLPGVGFAYLGKWKWAALNFAIAVAVSLAFAFLLPGYVSDDVMRLIGFGLAGGSAAAAQQVAEAMNKETLREAEQAQTLDEIGRQSRLG